MLCLSALALLPSCTTLPAERVDKLIICNTPLEQVRRNLLLLGYGLKANETDFITTDAKDAFGFGLPTSFLIKKLSPSAVRIRTKWTVGMNDQDAEFVGSNEAIHLEIRRQLCAKTDVK